MRKAGSAWIMSSRWRTSGLLYLVFSNQTVKLFFCEYEHLFHYWACCTNCTAIWFGLKTVSKQHAVHGQQRYYSIQSLSFPTLAESFLSTLKSTMWKIHCRLFWKGDPWWFCFLPSFENLLVGVISKHQKDKPIERRNVMSHDHGSKISGSQ